MKALKETLKTLLLVAVLAAGTADLIVLIGEAGEGMTLWTLIIAKAVSVVVALLLLALVRELDNAEFLPEWFYNLAKKLIEEE